MRISRALWFVRFYRRNGRLWVRSWWRRFELEPGMAAELTKVAGPRRRLTILSDGEVLWSCVYWPSLWNLVIDPDLDFTSAEPEDFDLGLMVSNVLSNPARLERLRTGGG